MYRASRWLVRISLLQLVVGALLGALLLAVKAGFLPGELFVLRGAHREMLTVGWLVQFAIGVGSWLLPPVRSLSIRERPLLVVALLLNGGVLAVAAATLVPAAAASDGLRFVGRGLEAAGLAIFAWPLMTGSFR